MVLTALPKNFYKKALEKVKPFQEKQSLTIRSVATDQMVSSLGRQDRLEHKVEPDWDDLKSQVAEFITPLSDLEVRNILKDKFGLRTQDEILAQFGSNRSRKQQNSTASYRPAATFRTGGSNTPEPDEVFDEDEDFE